MGKSKCVGVVAYGVEVEAFAFAFVVVVRFVVEEVYTEGSASIAFLFG